MRSMRHLFQVKKKENNQESSLGLAPQNEVIDEKTIFFLFERIVGDYYGQRGRKVIHPVKYQAMILTVKVASPLWANELLIQEQELCRRLNEAVGGEVLQGVKVLHGLSAER